MPYHYYRIQGHQSSSKHSKYNYYVTTYVLILPTLQFFRGDPVLGNDVHDAAPAGNGVAVHRTQQTLRNGFKELVGLQIGAPQRFGQPVQIARAIAADDKIVRLHAGANEIHAAEKGFVIVIESGNDGFHVVGTKALFVQQRAHEMRKHGRGHVPLFRQLIQLNAVVQLVLDGLHVRRQSAQPDINLGLEAEYLGEIRGDGGEILAEAPIRRNGDAVFARHGDNGGAVVVHTACAIIIISSSRRGRREREWGL